MNDRWLFLILCIYVSLSEQTGRAKRWTVRLYKEMGRLHVSIQHGGGVLRPEDRLVHTVPPVPHSVLIILSLLTILALA